MQLISYDIVPGVFPVSLRYRKDDGGNHRCCVVPDDDISDLPAEAQDRIRGHWAKMDLTRWQFLAHPPVPPVTTADVKAEAERRIALVAEVGTRADMALEWQALRDRQAAGTFTDADKARAAELKSVWQRIEAIKAAGQALADQDPVPGDYATGTRWPG